ncbi:MAG TPA: TonB-dependent receptor [Vicinamibacterales bacterium]|nr:TonB-dependent receptor [Vicinamibacterales bacterium]
MRTIFSALVVLALAASPTLAQSTAANGTIEGTITDTSGGVLPGVTVTVVNTETGADRTVVTNEKGIYRAPLLPLGTYKVSAELQGFKKFEQTDIKLLVGQTQTVNATLAVGTVSETITVNSSDLPALETSRIDIGHTMTDLEVHNLPLVARNPYNFALVQPGVTGIENVEFGVPRLSANGAAMRINYMIDGNTNTEKDRAGLRLLPMSEVMIQEVKVVTTGFAPEFGQTMGMVYNAVTPSGTNKFRGEGSYLFRRKPFSAFPFFFGCGSSTVAANCPSIASVVAAGEAKGVSESAQRPDTRVDTGTADVGGPIVQNKAFFYAGWEQTRRDLSSTSLITANPSDVSAVGAKAQPTAAPNVQTAKFAIGKGDFQLGDSSRLTARWIRFHNDAPYNSGGGLAILDRATDFLDAMDSTAGQVVSSLGSNKLNEFRFQYAHRHQTSVANADSGASGPAVTIPNIISFGPPIGGTGQGNAGIDFKQDITQAIDNFTYIRAAHSYKFGFDWQHIYDGRTNAPQFVYQFGTVAAYLAAKSGANPFGYTNMTEIVGNLSFNMSTNVFSTFVQDDWQIAPSVKLLYGVRYDLYKYPDGLGDAPLAQTHTFNTDKNNFGPRVGVAWSVDPSTVVRASTGVMYDQPILGGYEQAIALSGAPSRAAAYTFTPTQVGAPAFPNTIASGSLNITPWAVDPNFVVGHTWQSNVQVERGFARDMTASVGFMYAKGSDLPVVSDANLIGVQTVGTLADGRPIYSTAINASTRVDPRFNHINEVQSIGDSTFKGMTVMFSKRYSSGLSYNLQYVLAKGLDNTPLLTQLTVQSESGRTDPSNLNTDIGPNPLDMRHSVNGNIVYVSQNHSPNRVVRELLSGNEIGVLIQVNSGLPVNIAASGSLADLNKDGVTSDRPLFVARNSLYLPARKNVDLRYTRWIPITGSVRGEVIAELKNVFNTVEMAGISTGTVVDAAGNPVAAIPTDPNLFPNPSGYEQRKFQLGFKVRF